MAKCVFRITFSVLKKGCSTIGKTAFFRAASNMFLMNRYGVGHSGLYAFLGF